MRRRQYGFTSVIRLGDEFKVPSATGGLNAVIGKTYKIEFDLLEIGKAYSDLQIGIGLAKTPYENGTALPDVFGRSNGENDTTILAEKVTVHTIANTSVGSGEWQRKLTVYFTVTEEMADTLATNPQLVLWVTGGNTYDATNRPDAIAVYFDNITVTSVARYQETDYGTNDYTTAKTDFVATDTKSKRGNSVTVADGENTVVRNGYETGVWDGGHYGAIYLGDDYTAAAPKEDSLIKAQAGKTYIISFKWKYTGTQTNVHTLIGAALSKYPSSAFSGDTTLSAKKVYAAIASGVSYPDSEWMNGTISYTVDSDDTATYPYLVLYTQNMNSASGLYIYFDDITVKAIYSEVTKELFTDEIVVDNGFDDANAIVSSYTKGEGSKQFDDQPYPAPSHWISEISGNYFNGVQGYCYSGAIIPTYDPLTVGDDHTSENKVLRYRKYGTDVGIIRIADSYDTPDTTTTLTVEAGKTYYINFKYLAEGYSGWTATNPAIEFGIGLANTDYEDMLTIDDVKNRETLIAIPRQTYGESKWIDISKEFTAPEVLTEGFDQLVIWANGGLSGQNYMCIYFDDITVVTGYAAATVNYNYENGALESASKAQYYSNGNITQFTPSDVPVPVKWYTDDAYSCEYNFTEDYTEYMDITLYGLPQYIKGDIRYDGIVDDNDLTDLRQHLLGDQTAFTEKFGNVNDIDGIDIRDLVRLKIMVQYPESNNTSVVLSLYAPEGNTYSYGLAWQSDVQLLEPIVEYTLSTDENWENAMSVKGTKENSVAHQTFQLKDGYDYDTVASSFSTLNSDNKYSGNWYHSGIVLTHDIINVYSNKLVISGLTAGKTYKYRVGDAFNGVYTDEGSFTAYDAGDSDGFNFIYMTDSQESFSSTNVGAWNATLKTALENMPDAEFIAHGGDIVNWGAIEEQWSQLLEYNKDYLMNIPLMSAAGNHELNMTWSGLGLEYYDFNNHSNLNYTNDYDKFDSSTDFVNGNTGTYYSYNYKNVHFITLNTNDIYITNRHKYDTTYVLGNAQLAWLKADLEAVQSNENIDFIIVNMHHGLYTTAGAGLGSSYIQQANLREQLQPIFAQYGVDLVLNGHDHVYSRTKALNGEGTVVEEGGVVYLTGGVAGVNAPDVSYFENTTDAKTAVEAAITAGNSSDKYAKCDIATSYTHCWTEISVTSTGISVTTYGNNSTATVIDSFTISK